MRHIGTFSGGKDSLAVAIWMKNNLVNPELAFCDTKWEAIKTYQHIDDVTKQLDIPIKTLVNLSFEGLVELFIKKKRAASTKARFCTEELKVKPMIDYILSIKDDVTIYQGVRAEESEARRYLSAKDEYFKFYFEPYGFDKKGRPKYHTYRKKDVFEHLNSYSVDVVRPILKWGFEIVFQYIFENGLSPNPLYFEGFSRVGCFPCVMCTHSEVVLLMERYPERIEEIRALEQMIGRTFFPPGYIPTRYCSLRVISKNGKAVMCPTIDDVLKYLLDDPNQTRLFEKNSGCISVYNICDASSAKEVEYLKAHYNV